MAEVATWWAYVSFIDSKLKVSSVEARVTEADAQAYFAAADPGAQALTTVGALILGIAGLSRAPRYQYGVKVTIENDATTPPDAGDEIFNTDKISVHYAAGLDNYSFTIPAWNPANITIAGRDGTALLDAPAQVLNFVNAFEATARAKNGGVPTVTQIKKIR